MFIQDEKNSNEHQVIELTRFMVHKHYCENDVEPIIALMDREIVWIGAGEQEYATGLERLAEFFGSFRDRFPNVSYQMNSTMFLNLHRVPFCAVDVCGLQPILLPKSA